MARIITHWANKEAMVDKLVTVLSSLDMTLYKWYKLTSVCVHWLRYGICYKNLFLTACGD